MISPVVRFKAQGCLVGGAIAAVREDRAPSHALQQMRALCESIADRRGFDLMDCLQRSAVAGTEGNHYDTKLSWTHLQIRTWFETKGRSGRHPQAHATNAFVSAGVATMVAPVGILAGLREDDALTEGVYALGVATHGDIQASTAAFFVAEFISALVRQPRRLEPDEVADLATKVIERTVASEEKRRAALTREGVLCPAPRPSLVKRLRDVHAMYSPGRTSRLRAKTLDALREQMKAPTTSVLSIVPLALAIALRNATDFHEAVAEAAQLGGAIPQLVGEIVGANVGLTEIIVDKIHGSPHGNEFLRLSADLIAAA